MAQFYTPFNHKNWEDIVGWIRRFGEGGEAAIVTTVSGDANIYSYRELARQGITAESMPAMTLSIGEGELPAIAGPEMAGHVAAWSYLHAIDSPENRAFVAAWRKFCGAPNVVTNDPMEATWISFNLWKEAVTRAGSVDVEQVRRALSGLRVRAPSGFEVFMDHANHHLHKPVVIGRITPDARIVPVWMSDHLIAPEPWSPWSIAEPLPSLASSCRAPTPSSLSRANHRCHRDTELVMAGLVPAIHVLNAKKEIVDARHKAGHDKR